MIVEIGGLKYECIRGSDIIRDGIYLELSTSDGQWVLEIFYSDQTGKMTLSGPAAPLSLEVVEWVIAQAKVRLPPES